MNFVVVVIGFVMLEMNDDYTTEHYVFTGKASMKNSNPKPQELTTKLILKGLERAAKEARRQAKIHGTKVWVMADGKVVGLKP